ncbi:polyprenol monophosphomannose synthase [Helicobacter sp. XJK30-2]|uniref:Polyprenol monophosphomannose synthase n=1 Tax=Helicobacter zhangjianzhongii TaxID=2974574 RepID=A0ACC6FRW7_9HELI|nr:polyprenol monophosphomannose synthase [Helicobacter sp. XJK30-2]
MLRKAWQSISAQADSKKAQNREALESTCEKTAENTKVDSRVVNSASAESVDCHAANTARNDDKNAFSLESTFENNATSKNADSSSATNLSELAKDSRISKETSPSGERYPLFSKETSHSKAKSSKEAKTPKPLICIPTYNESNNIAALLCEIFSRFPEIHALVIDDNSTDGTQEILNSLAHTYPHLHLLKRSGKLGLASAYIDGFSWGLKSGYSHFIQMDADFSHHPRYLAQTLANLPHFEVVINSRNIIGGGVLGWGLGRKILSRFGSLYARLWLGARVMDFTGGFNAYSARALSAIDLHSIKSSGYCFQIEMKYRAYKAGLRLLELPIIFEDRVAGKSKMSKTIVLEALWRTPLLRLRVKRAER